VQQNRLHVRFQYLLRD